MQGKECYQQVGAFLLHVTSKLTSMMKKTFEARLGMHINLGAGNLLILSVEVQMTRCQKAGEEKKKGLKESGDVRSYISFGGKLWRQTRTAFHRFPESAKRGQARRYLGTYPCHKRQNLGSPEKSWGTDGDDHRILRLQQSSQPPQKWR